MIKIGALRIRWGNENAVDGSPIPFYFEILWWPRKGWPRMIFSNYTGE